MNISEIRNLCIKSAEKYYDYLKKHDKGIDEIIITQKMKLDISGKLWELKLGGRIFNVDAIKIHDCRNEEEYDNKHFIVESYDVDSNRLVIEFNEENLNFITVEPCYLKIKSDLKFLVENVKQWYINNGSNLGLDTSNKCINNKSQENIKSTSKKRKPDSYQKEAINNSLSNKQSYVWGPPGTGKTRFVLTDAIINYIGNYSNLIGVFAPTNNSLDVVMKALLEFAEHNNIPRDKFLRLGVPSRKFASKYPEVCESKELNKKLNEIERQLQIIRNVLTYRKGENTLTDIGMLIPYFNELQTNLIKRDKLLLNYSRLNRNINYLNKKANTLVNKVKRAVSSKKTKKQLMYEVKMVQLDEIKDEIEIVEEHTELLLEKIKRIKSVSDKINKELESLDFLNMQNIKENIDNIKTETEKYISIRLSDSKEYKKYSDEQLNELINKYEKEMERLKAQSLKERIKNSIVIGATLDTYISRFPQNDIDFNHIFLDEAGYVPLIKALVLFNGKTPVTMLGDHRQLPPVCEMNEIDLNKPQNRKVSLWGKSALFCETMFYSSKDRLIKKILLDEKPKFKYTNESKLKFTYRFGYNLAKILDESFYEFGFDSAKNTNASEVSLFLIDAPLSKTTSKRENVAEIDAIRKLFKSSYINYNDDYVILTPYNDQVALINSQIPDARRANRVLGIFRSQGREWDSVILSVADCGNTKTPWFTDTINKKSKGNLVMNTAISRVKKNLFLVCDKSYWLNRHDRNEQFISKLINVCTEIQV